MLWRYPDNPSAYNDGWEDQPGQGAFYQWGLGVALPIVLMAYGIRVIALRQITLGNAAPVTLEGLNAVASGVAWISAGLFVHCHYFWGNIFNQAWFAVLGKIIGACGFIGGLAFVLVRNGILGIS